MTEANAPPPAAEEEDLDLDAALDALDLDMNCLESTSFTANDAPDDDAGDAGVQPQEETTTTTTNDATKQADEEPENEVDWKDRPEIYSRHFRPAPREREALEEIAALLSVKSGLLNSTTRTSGVAGGNFFDNLLGGAGNDSHAALEEDDNGDQSPQAQWDRLVAGKSTAQTQKLPISILLKHGKGVMYKDVDFDETTGMSGTVTRHGCDLILLTRGFLIAQRETKSGGGLLGGLNSLFGGQKKPPEQKEEILQILGSALWTQVCQIQHIPMKSSLVLTCGVAGAPTKDQVRFEIVVPSSDLEQWLSALQTAATQAHLNFASSTKRDMHEERGWQYRLCHTPWFTEAVTGDVEDDDFGLEMTTTESAEEGLDQLDTFNGLAPLHYATRANHYDVMRHLLQAGANPNVADKEGKTPMYYGTYT